VSHFFTAIKPRFFILFLLFSLASITFFYSTPPLGVAVSGWQTFIIFILCLSLIITKMFDMGTVALLAISLCLLSKTLSLEYCLSKFSYPITWLILLAFFISQGFMASGLGTRIALMINKYLGSTPLTLSYSLMLAEVLIAPLIPSNTARGGGLIVPITKALGENVFGAPSGNAKNYRHINAFLLYCCFYSNLISSTLFLTAMAGNPMIAIIAQEHGFQLNWSRWFLSFIAPAIVCLLAVPMLLIFLIKPQWDKTHIQNLIKQNALSYANLKPLSSREILMGMVFLFLLIGWMFGEAYGLDATSVGFIGISTLLLVGVLDWKDLSGHKEAWTTFIWLGTLFMLTSAMKDFGMISWIADILITHLPPLDTHTLLVVLTLSNFYIHYLFASLTSHILTLFQPLVIIGLTLGIPVEPLILSLSCSTALSAGLTHYGTGSGTITYATGYWTLKQWWWLGLCTSQFCLAIFLLMGLFLW
jgi:DASS family divalent anion:Na+ symporter